MAKEITKAYILQQIQDKFKLRDLVPAQFTFEEAVIPVYNIEQHLTKWVVVEETKNITSAAAFTFFDVPQTERWLLRSYMVIFGATGAHKGTGLLVRRPIGATDFIYLDLKKGQEVSYLVNLPVPVVLQSGDRLEYLIDTYVSDQSISIYIDVQKEEIR